MSTDTLSPILAIKQRESEATARLAAAQDAEAQAILDARQAASRVREQAERDGQAAAAVLYRAELEAADAEAEALRLDGEAVAAEISARGGTALDEAVRRILATVLPGGEPCC